MGAKSSSTFNLLLLGFCAGRKKSKEKSKAAEPSGLKSHIHSNIPPGRAWGKTVLWETEVKKSPAMGFKGDREMEFGCWRNVKKRC